MQKRTDIKTIYLKKVSVRIMVNRMGQIRYLCLHDICRIINKNDFLRSDDLIVVCPRYISEKVGSLELIFVTADDVRSLIRFCTGNTKTLDRLCRVLEQWLDKQSFAIQDTSSSESNYKPVIAQTIAMCFNRRSITFKVVDGNLFVNATQMAKLKGLVPTSWINKPDVIRHRYELVRQGVFPDIESQVMTSRGKEGATWIAGGLAIKMALEISDEFYHWLMQFLREKFPDMYGVHRARKDEGLEVNLPDNLEQSHQEIKRLQKIIQQNAEAVEYYDSLIRNREWYTTTLLAAELDITIPRLHQFLRKEGILIRSGKTWVITPEYKHYQTTFTYFYTDPNGTTYGTAKSPRWTKFGRDEILKLWKQKNSISYG